ncbi:MAG TPA: hypothetical protein VFR47_32495 [Anaerolineales bacterium]|nr:hypothetical protein [Anaerolineales bacterium]
MMQFPFEYRKLGDFTYHVLTDPDHIKAYVMVWIMREWELDHKEAPNEHWTVEWMDALPTMKFSLEVVDPGEIHPHPDLISTEEFLTSLQERADEREESMLRGVSIEPLLINRDGFQLMDGYTRYTVLKKYNQREVYAYVGEIVR